MDVVVNYRGRLYKYTEVNSMTTWVNDKNNLVPVSLHSILREKALASGIDESVFYLKNTTINTSVEKSKSRVNNVINTTKINPFKIGVEYGKKS
jgi:hypothetical protein